MSKAKKGNTPKKVRKETNWWEGSWWNGGIGFGSHRSFVPFVRKRKEVIKPYLHNIDERTLRTTLNDYINNKLNTGELHQIMKTYGSNWDPSSDISTDLKMLQRLYTQFPTEIAADIFNLNQSDIDRITFAKRADYNQFTYQVLDRVNDPTIKIVTRDNPLASAIVTKYMMMYIMMMLLKMQQQNSSETQKFLNQLAKAKPSKDADDEEEEDQKKQKAKDGKADPDKDDEEDEDADGEPGGKSEKGEEESNEKGSKQKGEKQQEEDQKDDKSEGGEGKGDKPGDEEKEDPQGKGDAKGTKDEPKEPKGGDGHGQTPEQDHSDKQESQDEQDPEDDEDEEEEGDEDESDATKENHSSGSGGNNPQYDVNPVVKKIIDDFMEGESRNSNNLLEKLMMNALQDINNIKETMTDEEMRKLWEDLQQDPRNQRNLMKMDPTFVRKMAAEYRNIKVNGDRLKERIKGLLDRSISYFSSKEIVRFENIFDADSLDGLEDWALLHPGVRRLLTDDINVKTSKRIGKIDAYVDISGSMDGSSGTNLTKLDFAKAIVLRLIDMDMLNNLYVFNDNIYPVGSDLYSILGITNDGGTNITRVVNAIENKGVNALIITDCESTLSTYSDKAFFIGVRGARFGSFSSGVRERMAENRQMVCFDGSDILDVDKNGNFIQ